MEKSIEDYKRELLEYSRRAKVIPANTQEVRPPEVDENIGTRPDVTLPPQFLPDPENYTGSGGLTVALTHSRGLYPVAGASVTIYDGDKVIEREVTDLSGKTKRILLPAPAKIYSESPGENPRDVSAFYDLLIEADGFLSVRVEGVPIFDGVNTTQPLDLTYTAAAENNQPIIIKYDNSYRL